MCELGFEWRFRRLRLGEEIQQLVALDGAAQVKDDLDHDDDGEGGRDSLKHPFPPSDHRDGLPEGHLDAQHLQDKALGRPTRSLLDLPLGCQAQPFGWGDAGQSGPRNT